MRFHVLVAADFPNLDTPYLIAAEDDATVQADPADWARRVAEERAGAHAAAAIVVDVPDEQVLALLYPEPAGTVQGTASPDPTA